MQHDPGFEFSQIFNLHIFASGIFGYMLNGKTTCIFDNYSFMNINSEISCCFKGKLSLSSLRLQLYKGWNIREWSFRLGNILCCSKEFSHFQRGTQIHFNAGGFIPSFSVIGCLGSYCPLMHGRFYMKRDTDSQFKCYSQL